MLIISGSIQIPNISPLLADFVRKLAQRTPHFLTIDLPVPERTGIVVPLSEPSVVQHKELDPDLSRTAAEFHQLFLIERKEKTFPTVDQNRARLFLPFAADNVFRRKRAHLFTYLGLFFSAHKNRFRSFKRFSRIKFVIKQIIVDARKKPQSAQRRKVNDLPVISRPDKITGNTTAPIISIAGDHIGIVRVGRKPCKTCGGQTPPLQKSTMRAALTLGRAVQRDGLPIPLSRDPAAGSCSGGYAQPCLPYCAGTDRGRDDIAVPEHGKILQDLQPYAVLVPQYQTLAPRRRRTGSGLSKSGFPFCIFASEKNGAQRPRPVARHDLQHRFAVAAVTA